MTVDERAHKYEYFKKTKILDDLLKNSDISNRVSYNDV